MTNLTIAMASMSAFSGRRLPTFGETIWNYPEGDFKYGTFRLKSINYNVTQ